MTMPREPAAGLAPIREFKPGGDRTLFTRLAAEGEPLVMRGLAADWPLVSRAGQSAGQARRYLLDHYDAEPVTVFYGEPASGGRIFYADDMSSMNFSQVRCGLDEFLGRLARHESDTLPPTIYMGSTALARVLPELLDENSFSSGNRNVSVRIWIGNRSTVAAHFDVLDNVACVCAGRRRFTLFPPEQLENLYVGPLDFTPAGQAVSLVDLDSPDLERFPRFAEALEAASTALLEPGDAIYLPAMWWHHVASLDTFNVLINHWWRDAPSWAGAPGDALLHAILSIRDLPAAQRRAWRRHFEHYVFDAGQADFSHIPAHRRGILGELDDASARRLRAMLRDRLNR